MNILLSIIVPVYKVDKFLPRCMNSLLNQTLKDIEIILVDDESPDDCPQLCEQYAKTYSHIKVIHKKNEGLGFARNTGLEVALGEYVAFIDSDDFIDPDMFENLYQYAKKNDCDVVFCGYNIYRDKQHIIKCQEFPDYSVYKGKEQVTNVLMNMVGADPSHYSDVRLLMSVWRAIYSRSIIEKNHLRFVSEREYIAEDIIFHLDFLPHCLNIGFIPQTHYYYCDNGTSLTRSYRADRFNKEIFLYYSIKERLAKIGSQQSYRNRLDRYLLMKTRVCISQQVRYINLLGYKVSRQNIKDIINSQEVDKLLYSYPYKLLPVKHRLFFLLLKYHLYDLIIFLFKLSK